MALIYNSSPIDASWSTQFAQNQHVATIVITNFVATTYYDMIAELQADGGLPAFAAGPDPAVASSNLRFVKWEQVSFVCAGTQRSMTIRMYYETQSSGLLQAADSNGPVIFRQRATQKDVTYTEDAGGSPNVATYSNDRKVLPWTTQRSLILFECERYEDANPIARVLPLIDKVNSSSWNGYSARTVQFTDFESDTRDDNTTWLCFYTFIYDPQGHDQTLQWTNDFGQVPEDIATEPSATIKPEILGQASFAPLNITLPS